MKQKIEYILLAKSIPEYDKRTDGVYTCSLGYSPTLGKMIRVYPLPLVGMKKWGRYEIEVEKNKRDSRQESWKLSSYTRFEKFVGFEKDMIYKGDCNKANLLKIMYSLCSPSISDLNKNRSSIGIVSSDTVNPYWVSNNRFINTAQVGMFEDVEIADFTKYTKETKCKEARVKFKDQDGDHDLQLNEWQYYEYQRKFKADKEAFRYIAKYKRKILLLGNMLQYRNNWMVLSVFNDTRNITVNQPVRNDFFMQITKSA